MALNKNINSKEKETIKAFYAALNQNDMEAALELFDEQAERVEAEDFPTPGIYRGRSQIRSHILSGRATWAEGGCDPESFIVSGDKVVVSVHVLVRLKEKMEWIDAYIADVFQFRNGKISEMRSFIEMQKALNWASAK